MAQPQLIPAKGEAPLGTKFFKQFQGCYTKSDRSAMPQEYFYHLENLQPIGASNLHSVNNISAPLHDFAGDIIYWSQYVQIGSVPYQICLANNGKVFAYNYNTLATTQISSALSGAGSRLSQWMNQYVWFSDLTGLYYWDGTIFAAITGSGVPVTATDICVYAGRVWVSAGRLISYTSAYDGTMTNDPTQASAWQTVNGAGFLNLTDPLLSGFVTRLWAQNGYMFIFGGTCLYSISNVYVPTGASPPTPVFTLLPVQGIIGTDQPASVFPFNRELVFANRYGAWITDGVDAKKFSEEIDGTFQYLSFSPSISGGQCVVNNILCTAFLMQRLNDPVFGSNTVIGLWSGQKTWWFANFGTVTFLCTALVNSVPTLIAFIGNKMYTLFTSSATNPNGIAITPLWDMDDPLSDKQLLRAGVRVVFLKNTGTLSLNVDGYGSSTNAASSNMNSLVFVGSGAITFVGSGAISWTTVSTYELFQGSPPGVWSAGVGMTLNTTGANVQIAMFAMDYKLRERWAQTLKDMPCH